ncbi:hypothetical protein GM418_28660 [Maribellus comscasis]|uniref:Uncharacterized protein n=1 Tax=Maribellus comscasis TaxID=2681766 RepID=A0A6I6K1K9_9BACT|nr:hypothetical protein [Maribellus comscasis]QGY47499.1 hypothetical protein GM418_28660 [Maribellus comscasis]
MKKIILILILFVIVYDLSAQQKGDSLAILYRRVYAYKNPKDLSTRYDKIPFSYLNEHKLIFIAKSEKYPKYYQAKTIKGDTIFVKAKLVSADQNLTHAQISQDIKDGKRKRSPGEIGDLTNLLPTWAIVIIWAGIGYLLYRFWKRYYKFDRWFCKKARTRKRPIKDAWFIKLSILAGVILGAVLLFARHEFYWFLQEGFQVWGNYPNKWDWIMWGALFAFIVIVLVAVAQSFSRFSAKYAVIYSLLVLVISTIYFIVGVTLSVFILIIYAITHARGSTGSGGSGGSGGSYNSGSTQAPGRDSAPVGATKYDESGQKVAKNSDGEWRKTTL